MQSPEVVPESPERWHRGGVQREAPHSRRTRRGPGGGEQGVAALGSGGSHAEQ